MPLAAHHRLDKFDCGKPALKDWLLSHARQAQDNGSAKPYLVGKDNDGVAGYVSVTDRQVDTLEVPDRIRRGICAVTGVAGWAPKNIMNGMASVSQLLAFTIASVLITATPGPDNLMVLSMSVSKGRRQGIAFGLGCAVGCLSHTLLAVLGVSAFVAATPIAFTVLKWIGGSYLVWLGVNALRSAGDVAKVSGVDSRQASARQLFLKGMFANAINPKVVLFFLSFLPQFVVAEQGNIGVQLGVLGVVFAVQAGVLFAALAFFAGSIGDWLTRQPRSRQWLDRIAGVVLVGLGLRMVGSN